MNGSSWCWNLEWRVSENIASLRKKHDVLHDGFTVKNSIQSYKKSFVKNVTLNSFYIQKIHYLSFEFTIEKNVWNFPVSFNHLKNIAKMHRELDVLGFLKHCHNIEVDVLAKNCIVNNWKTLHQKMNIAHPCCWWGQHPQEWKQGHLWRISL